MNISTLWSACTTAAFHMWRFVVDHHGDSGFLPRGQVGNVRMSEEAWCTARALRILTVYFCPSKLPIPVATVEKGQVANRMVLTHRILQGYVLYRYHHMSCR